MNYLKSLRDALKGQKYLILDTETTGLHDGEIVQIAVINSDGEILMNTLVKPAQAIPADATAIHHITDEMCEDAPSWPEITEPLKAILKGQNLVIYNAVYDRKMMHKSQERHNLPKIEWKEIATIHCAMEAYAEFYGEYNSYRGSYVWQKLTVAAHRCGIEAKDAHSALGDCIMTLGVVQAMLKAESEAGNG